MLSPLSREASDPKPKDAETPGQGLEPTDQSRSGQDQLEIRPQGRAQEVRLQILFQAVEDLVTHFFLRRDGRVGRREWTHHGGRSENPVLPVSGPPDAQAGIDIPLEVGHAYTYYIFSQPNGGYERFVHAAI